MRKLTFKSVTANLLLALTSGPVGIVHVVVGSFSSVTTMPMIPTLHMLPSLR